MRVATWNIRTGRAVDLSSFWWTRRRAVVDVVRRVDADVWAFQEVIAFQRRHLARAVLSAPEWDATGEGREAGGGGEQTPVFHRAAVGEPERAFTRWFGPSPAVAGSVMAGAARPRIATAVDLRRRDTGGPLRIVNLHLDSDSVGRRAESIRQVAGWLDDSPDCPVIVMGDFNGVMTDPGYEALRSAGLRSTLPPDAGPTSNGFGRRLGEQRQIDHVFVSAHFDVRSARIDVASGHASDHYPVVVDVELVR